MSYWDIIMCHVCDVHSIVPGECNEGGWQKYVGPDM